MQKDFLPMPGSLDRFDHAILDRLARDGRITLTALAEAVGLSKTPVQARMRRLEAEGYIAGYRAVLDPVKLGREHIAFVQVTLSDTRAGALDAFNAAARAVPEIEECHMIAGSFDYLVKVRTRSMRHFRELYGRVLSGLPHVASSSTFVCMEAVKDDLFRG